MNYDSWMSFIRTLLAAGGPVTTLLVALKMPQDQAVLWQQALLALFGAAGPVISLIWGLAAHSPKGTLEAAARVPGFEGHVSSEGSPHGAIKVARNTKIPNITLTPPFVPANKTD
jgi:hypothetical protein